MPLDAPPAPKDRLRQTLAADEERRAAGFRFPRDRERYVVGRGALRAVLGQYLRRRPEDIRFSYNAEGKPALAGEFSAERLRFNVAHADGLALVAVAREREVGVDLEKVRAIEVEEIAERFFSAAEVAVLRGLPADRRVDAFFRCWTRKEAYLKATGKGLSGGLDQFDVSLAPGEPAALLAHRGAPAEAGRWQLRELAPAPGYVGALAVEGPSPAVWCGDLGGWPVTADLSPPMRFPPFVGAEPRGPAAWGRGQPMRYSQATLWYERRRFLPGDMAVAFSALLILVQGGLLVGQFSLTSNPIDHARADLWVGHPMDLSVDLGRPIPERWLTYVAAQPEVVRTETYIIGLIVVDKPDGRSELCTVIGSALGDDALGAVRELTPELRERLTEPGSVVADETELGRLGFQQVRGRRPEVIGRRVRLVGTVKGLKSLAAPYLFCSLQTAHLLFQGIQEGQTIFVLAKCRRPGDAEVVARRLKGEHDLLACPSEEFANRTRWQWVTATKAGLAALWSAVLGLLVGLAITSQTLYAATAASRREYAVLDALGVPTWRMGAAVLAQSFWLGGRRHRPGRCSAAAGAVGRAQRNSLGVKLRCCLRVQLLVRARSPA